MDIVSHIVRAASLYSRHSDAVPGLFISGEHLVLFGLALTQWADVSWAKRNKSKLLDYEIVSDHWAGPTMFDGIELQDYYTIHALRGMAVLVGVPTDLLDWHAVIEQICGSLGKADVDVVMSAMQPSDTRKDSHTCTHSMGSPGPPFPPPRLHAVCLFCWFVGTDVCMTFDPK